MSGKKNVNELQVHENYVTANAKEKEEEKKSQEETKRRKVTAEVEKSRRSKKAHLEFIYKKQTPFRHCVCLLHIQCP